MRHMEKNDTYADTKVDVIPAKAGIHVFREGVYSGWRVPSRAGQGLTELSRGPRNASRP